MKYKNLKVNVAIYSIYFYITGLVVSAASFPIFCNKSVETKSNIEYSYTDTKNQLLPMEERIIKIEEEPTSVEEEKKEVELFESNDDYYDLDANEYVTDQQLINIENFEITVENKTYEDLPNDNFDLFASVVAAECKNGDIYDALATASSIVNRCDSERWVEYVNSYGRDGENPIDQLTFYGQYEGYLSGAYNDYLDGNLDMPQEVLDACVAVWFNGIRNHNYCSFRAACVTSYSDIQIVEGGNRFADEIDPIKTYK